MEIINKHIIINHEGKEEVLELGELYEFEIDIFKPRIGKLIEMSDKTLTFDCSKLYHSNIINHPFYRFHSLKKINKDIV